MAEMGVYLEWNAQGLFPLPEETEEAFISRSSTLLQCRENGDTAALELLYTIYGARPFWVPLSVDKTGLSFWEAACTWIDKSIPTISIQLSPRMRKGPLARLYTVAEVLAHEYVHAIRYAFDSRFDEFFAYFITKHKKKGWFARFQANSAALFSSPCEVRIFLIALFLPLLSIEWTAVPFLLLLGGVGRLLWRKRIWKCALCHAQCICHDHALPLMVRLTDEELLLFAEKQPDAIAQWVQKMAAKELRWQIFYLSYFQ